MRRGNRIASLGCKVCSEASRCVPISISVVGGRNWQGRPLESVCDLVVNILPFSVTEGT